ncbi:hypothetical protein [Chamaesiphon sp. OTE_20_metabat_361]|uniref:hypothetical protein n=1 Tax=Chamaesiphon sp. OTE_20_metabat_361 TaxID=2964689 RepID=UPI00286BAB83|nr:hypothetical protein [Chamaesiphon sp. OTE_20_metabat_361]
MLLQHLQPFQVDPTRVDRHEIATLVNRVSINSKISEIQGTLDLNISLCAYLLKSYIDYQEIYFLSTNLILDKNNRPDYICGCYHQTKGVSWYAIVLAGPQEQTWDDSLQLTKTAKVSFDRLNYCMSNLAKILVANKLNESVEPNNVHGLLIIGQDREFFHNPQKQNRKRELNHKSAIKLRTYGAFLRKFDRERNKNWLNMPVSTLVDRLRARIDSM